MPSARHIPERSTRREFLGGALGGAALALLSQSRAAAAGEAPTGAALSDEEILARITPHRPSRGGRIPADLARRLGTAHVGGRYHLTSKPFLIEGAEQVHQLGFGGIKLWCTNLERGYPFNSDWRLPAAPGLAELVQHPYFEAAFALPFSVIALEVFAPPGPPGGRAITDPAYDAGRDEQAMYELSTYLLRRYAGRDVTFLLQNWEGDWMLRGAARDGWMRGEYPQLEARMAGFIRWFNARQRGIERARAEAPSGRCRVFHAVEVNRVFDAVAGIPTMTTHVLPHVRPDFISWSCYDGLKTAARDGGKTAIGLWRGLDLIQQQARTTQRDPAGRPAVFIGELGFPENTTTPAGAVEMMDGALGTLFARDVPYLLYWELYCNERKDGTRPVVLKSAQADELRGFWLVRPDGTKGGVGQYLQRLLSHAGGRLPASSGG